MVSAKWNGDFHRRTPSLEFGPDAFGTWLRLPPDTIAETLSPTETITAAEKTGASVAPR